jgi:formylglycine-generating enzyme required for sulfatase activity
LSAFRICGETFARDGNTYQARRCFEEGLRIAANDRELRQGLALLEPRPGGVRKWEGDEREMAWVPAGSYRRGASEGDRQAAADEFPVREIRVKGFWMDRYEVTNDEYRRCVEARACTVPRNTGAYDDPARGSNPVLWVSWIQARRYAEWAGKRLPRETEWEWAARAGAATRYPWGNNWIASLGNGFGLEGRDRFNADAPVGSFPANTWGIHDLIGNAAEYVQDTYHPSYEGAPTDGRAWEQETGPIAERQRVVRGGSFLDPPPRLRLSHRGSRREANPQRAVGFRCVAD